MNPARKESRLNVKEVIQLATVMSITCGAMTSIVAYVHAEFTVPKILNSTAEQVRVELEAHSKYPHPVSVSRSEIEMMQNAIEKSIDDFKADSNQRLTRIEQKLDRL